MANVASLTDYKRRFVRAKGDDSDPEFYDPSENDTFFMGIVCAEISANHDQIDCACCGSPDVYRGGSMSAPWKFGTVTMKKTGHLYGYALCEPCIELRKNDPDTFQDKVDAAFDAAMGKK